MSLAKFAAFTVMLGGAAAIAGSATAQTPGKPEPLPEVRFYDEGPRPDQPPPMPVPVDGKGMYWDGAEVKKAFGSKKITAPGAGVYVSSPAYSLILSLRPVLDPKGADSEKHDDATQIYFIVSGTGTQYFGGAPDEIKNFPNGNHVGKGPLKGGTSYRLKPGDVVLVPPGTWHQTLPDAGEPFTYHMVHVHTRRTRP